MRENLSNPAEDLQDGPQEAAEFVADVPSQPSRDVSDQKPAPPSDASRAQQQADAELKAALGSSEIGDEGPAASNQTKPTLPDIATGTHS